MFIRFGESIIRILSLLSVIRFRESIIPILSGFGFWGYIYMFITSRKDSCY